MKNKVLLLSIRPRYAEKIFQGAKKVELRRVRPNIQHGDYILVYVSSPTKALEGILQVDYVIEDHPNELWARVKNTAGVTRDEFNTYYDGANKGYGIFLKEAKRIQNPISLDKLRKLFGSFHPPQSYRYLRPNEVELYGQL
jgi:predicted transcriptional regulator